MDTITKILLAIVILHFIVGFLYLIYKLSPRKEESAKPSDPGSKDKEQIDFN